MPASPANSIAISSFLTKDNITFIIALIGACGTISGWVYFWITTRKNISISISQHSQAPNGLLLYIHITNNSHMSIAINDIAVILNGSEFSCRQAPQRVKETTRKVGKEVVGRTEYYSIAFPINLPALCGDHGYLYFSFEPEIQQPVPSTATFVIRTNRGRELRKTLSLGKELL